MNRDSEIRIDDLDSGLTLLSVLSELYPRLDDQHKYLLLQIVAK